MEDTAFALEALRRGYVDLSKLQECQKLQQQVKSVGVEIRLADLLVKQGALTEEQVREISEPEPPAPAAAPAKAAAAPLSTPSAIDNLEADLEREVSFTDSETFASEPSPEPPSASAAPSAPPSPVAPAAPPPPDEPIVVPKSFGPYTLTERVGDDEAGESFKAVKPSVDRTYLIRILPRAFASDPEALAALKAESKSRVGLAHPNLVKSVAFGVFEGRYFAATEFVEGRTLESLLAEVGPLPEKRAIEIASQVAGALEKCHAAGLAHGEARPDRILVTSEGAVKLMGPALRGSPLKPTPYLAPSWDASVRSDIFSLGAVLFHMVSGKAPAGADLRPERVSQRLATLVQKLTAAKEEDRPAEIAIVAAELQGMLRPRPPLHRKESAPEPKSAGALNQLLGLPTPALVGIGAGALLLIVILLSVMFSGGPTSRRGPGSRGAGAPAPEEVYQGLRGEIAAHLYMHDFGNAWSTLEEARSKLSRDQIEPLERQIREEAETAFERMRDAVEKDLAADRLDVALTRVEQFRGKVGAVQPASGKAEAEARRIAERRDLAAGAGAALAEFTQLRNAVLPVVEAGRFEEALAQLRLKVAEAKHPFLAGKIRDMIRDVEAKRTIAELKPEPAGKPAVEEPVDVSALVADARAAIARGDHAAAWVKLDDALSKSPRDAPALSLQAVCLLERGEPDEAASRARRALEIDPFQTDALFVMGAVLQTRQEYEDAVQHFTRAIGSNPRYAAAFLRRGVCFYESDRFEEALRDADEAAKLDSSKPAQIQAVRLRALCLSELDRAPEALEACAKWAQLDPKSKEVYLLRGDLLLSQGDAKGAQKEYETAKAIDVTDPAVTERMTKVEEALSTAKPAKPPPAPKKPVVREAKPKDRKDIVREQLTKMIAGVQKKVEVLGNGDVRVTAAYDFSTPNQISDFSLHNAKPEKGFVDLNATNLDDLAVALWHPRLRGNFVFRCVFLVEEVNKTYASAIILRTSNIGDAEQVGEGVGATYQNVSAIDLAEWELYLHTVSTSNQVLSNRMSPLLMRHYKGEKNTISLSQDGSKVTAAYGQGGKSVSANHVGPQPFHMRFVVAKARVKLLYFEVQGYLDAAWVDSVVSIPKTGLKNLYNGKDLNDWVVGGATSTQIDGTELVVDATPDKMASLVNKEVEFDRACHVEMKFRIEMMAADFTVGLGLVVSGNTVTSSNNYLLEFTEISGAPHLRVAQVVGGTLREIQVLRVAVPLRTGEYTLELRTEGNSLKWILNKREVLSTMLPVARFKAGLFVGSGKIRVLELKSN